MIVPILTTLFVVLFVICWVPYSVGIKYARSGAANDIPFMVAWGVLLIAAAVCGCTAMSIEIRHGNDSYARKCHQHNGVVDSSGDCIKRGSEIKI